MNSEPPSKLEEESLISELNTSEKEAFSLVDRALNTAVRQLQIQSREMSENVHGEVSSEEVNEPKPPANRYLRDLPVTVANIDWPQVGRFDKNLGESKIREFVLVRCQ